MKVYAHFLGVQEGHIWNLSKDGFQYRWRTILQFGNSWDVIGSVYMKNPGSAAPIDKNLPNDIMIHLTDLDKVNNQWLEFTPDNTMRCIARLFMSKNGSMQLNGIIQIFNLMNIRDADLGKALKMSKNSTEDVFSTIKEDIAILSATTKPVYLGWGGLGKNSQFKKNAEIVFNAVVDKNLYLNKEFYDNSFYHPQYLMCYGKNRHNCQWLLKAFQLNKRDFNFDYNDTKVCKQDILITNLKKCIKADGSLSWIYNENTLVYEYFTKIEINKYKGYKNCRDNIAVDIYNDGKNLYILLFLRSYNETQNRQIVSEIWDNIVYTPWTNSSKHICKIFDLSTSQQVIAEYCSMLLLDIKNYRDKKYPLK